MQWHETGYEGIGMLKEWLPHVSSESDHRSRASAVSIEAQPWPVARPHPPTRATGLLHAGACEVAASPRELQRTARGRGDALLRTALSFPGISALREATAARAFRRNRVSGNPFFGVFASLEEASAFIPRSVPHSYDNSASAELYRERVDRVFPHDYPVLYWMKALMPRTHRVFDLGGHVGIANYAYEPYLGSLAEIDWTVCDVPAVVEAGRRLAASRGRSGLSFTSRYEEANGADVMLGSGVLQYLPNGSLPALLARLPIPPRHLFINLLPTTDKPTFFTLNNIGTAICPYLVLNEEEFVASIVRHGYRTLDSWSTPEKKCRIPLHPERSVDAYRGFYFESTRATTSTSCASRIGTT